MGSVGVVVVGAGVDVVVGADGVVGVVALVGTKMVLLGLEYPWNVLTRH